MARMGPETYYQRAPENWDVPILAGADDDVQILAELFTRVEGQVEDLGHECVGAKDPRSADVGCLGEKKGGRCEDDVDGKTSDSASPSTHSLTDGNSEDLTRKEGDLVQNE